MRQKAPIILILLLFAVGVGTLSYPLVSEWYNGRAQTTVIENYGSALQELDEEKYTALREVAREYNESLFGNVILTDPFDESAAAKSSEKYEALLDINGDGMMGIVRIPKISVKLPVHHGTSHEVLEKGAGHLENTSLPIGGAGTHAVLSAHSGLPTSALFTDLTKLTEGDLFFLDVLDETLAYRVDKVEVVEPADVSGLRIDPAEDYVTLITCTPYGINSHRLLVRGVRTEYEETLEAEAAEAKQIVWNWPYIIAGLVFLLLMVLFIIILLLKKKKTDRKSPNH